MLKMDMLYLKEVVSLPDKRREDEPVRAGLKDINDVVIDTSLPREERVRKYLEQIGNPYRYLDGDRVVSISYAESDVSLQDRLKAYVLTL